ncbi:AMP-binding enzyme [Demequina globuliformis]|uniref:AMP-binding enzyme n=1 Tax=Demequina globuliformis TaxID=676202 RepID=UPI0009FE155B|nr:AMP-binding protein [Demequina globuliformis]
MTYARLVDGAESAITFSLADRVAGIAARTSGSTGEPREVLLSAAAVRASARSTLERLGGPAHWLLAMPTDRIAGAMVLARAAVADAQVARMAPGPFTAQAFCDAVDSMAPGRRYVSLVPTQVRRLVADPRGADALASFDAVLVGGAAPGMVLPSNAVETYGMTETCGGCVYDGVPLAGVSVRIDDDERICLGGPMLADGYADGDSSAFVTAHGRRWFATSDLGGWDGALTVYGRADDVIITGGHNVHPAAVERALQDLPGVREAVVVGVPDPEWGERVVALVVAADPAPSLAHVRDALDLPRHALPRQVVPVVSLPRTPAGKIDRGAAREQAAAAHGEENA